MRGQSKFQLAVLFVALFATACGPNEAILKSGNETSPQTNAAPSQTTFAKDLEEFRTAGFEFIFVLRRKDGGEIDREDRSVIKLNTDGANRRVSADNGRAFIIGTNNPIPPKNMAAIYARFAVENFSPTSETNKNANANTTK